VTNHMVPFTIDWPFDPRIHAQKDTDMKSSVQTQEPMHLYTFQALQCQYCMLFY